jgi:predicted transcriptional regulator
LWSLREASVKDVREVLTPHRALAYTTVMTVLDRLVRRGGVVRRKEGRSFVYTPVLSRESLRKLAVRQLVDSFFDGSEEALLRYLDTAGLALTMSAASVVDDHLDASLL